MITAVEGDRRYLQQPGEVDQGRALRDQWCKSSKRAMTTDRSLGWDSKVCTWRSKLRAAIGLTYDRCSARLQKSEEGVIRLPRKNFELGHRHQRQR